MLLISRLNRCLVCGSILAIVLCASGCVSNKAIDVALKKSTELAPPAPLRRPVQSLLTEFGTLLQPYVIAATGEQPIPIEIDFIGNESGIDKELPTDLGQYARAVIEKIGQPFATFRTWPAISAVPRPAAGALALMSNDRPKPPQPSYRLVGSLLRASERLVKGRDARADGLFGKGHGQTDAQITGDNRRTITSLVIALTLEAPNGIAVRGATAEYRIDIEKNDLSRSVSVYVGGSGIGAGSKVTVTQDAGDGLYDAMAVSVIHLLGNALLVPYYRCGSLFAKDAALDARVRDALSRLTRAELEQNVKRYLFVSGFSMDMHGPELVERDRAILAVEMQHHNFNFSNRADLVEFAMQLWSNLDYVSAAKRVSDRILQSSQTQREKLEQAAREQADLFISPVEFGWATSVPIVVLDLSRVKESANQDKILAAVRSCTGCEEIRGHPTKMILGIRMSSQPMELQRALRNSSLRLEYIWTETPSLRLLLVPLKATPTGPATTEARR